MPTFDSNGIAVNYIDEGAGPPIVLVHGFAANLELNWRVPGVINVLTESGRRVVALDCRGHGLSGKPHDPQAYENDAMTLDVIALMDHLGIAKADLMGYSMGGFISSWLLTRHPERFGCVILSGIGDGIVADDLATEMRDRMSKIADAMEARIADATPGTDVGRNFRIFAERTGADVAALAAMQRASRPHATRVEFANVRQPVLVLVGENDVLIGKADKLAAAIPGAKLVYSPGDHLTAPAQPAFKQAIVDFLAERSPAPAR